MFCAYPRWCATRFSHTQQLQAHRQLEKTLHEQKYSMGVPVVVYGCWARVPGSMKQSSCRRVHEPRPRKQSKNMQTIDLSHDSISKSVAGGGNFVLFRPACSETSRTKERQGPQMGHASSNLNRRGPTTMFCFCLAKMVLGHAMKLGDYRVFC